MSLRCAVLVVALCSAGHVSAEEIPDPIQGNWLGTWEGEGGMGGKNVAQIYGLGRGEYQAIFTAYDSGEQDSGVFTFSIRGASTSDGKAVFDQMLDLGQYGMFQFRAEIVDGSFTGSYSNGKEFQGTMALKRVTEVPDAVGMKPLPGAISLFNGKDLENWQVLGDDAGEWKIVEGVLVAPVSDRISPPKSGHLASKAVFQNSLIHVEFRVPYLPEKRGERRGASGLFLLGKYELQIVDSFGFPRTKDAQGYFADTDALGAIYHQHAPLEQPALPPGEWQAFDIMLTAETTDAEGNVTKPTEITVQLNGKTIHDRVELTKPTSGAPALSGAGTPALILQNAGQAVAFRNLWYVPLDATAN